MIQKILFLFLTLIASQLFAQVNIPYKKSVEIASQHKKLAVLPPKVNIEIKDPSISEKIKEQEKIESLNFQSSIIEFLTKKKNKKNLDIEILTQDETNRILKEKGIQSFSSISYKELAELLEVDGILSSRFSMARPLTNAEALLSSLVIGFSSSKTVSADITLTDRGSGKAIWNFNWTNEGVFSKPEVLIESLMKSAVVRIPYKSTK